MELLTVPPPTAYIFFDDQNNHHVGSSSTTTPSPPPHNRHQLQLQLPMHSPKLKLSRISSQPLQPISPQPTIRSNKTKMMKKKKKGSSTSDILSLMEALYNPIPIDIYTSLIKECTFSGDPQTALHLHAHFTNSSGIYNNPPLPFINRILIMLASCGLLENARQVFDKMSKRDFNSWATLFVAYYDNADYEQAVNVFVSMIEDLGMMEFEFPSWIWCCLLKACACSVNFNMGMQVHGWLLKLGNCDDINLSSSLISFYGRFSCLEDANVVFNRVARHSTMTWTAKIVGGCREKQFSKVLCDFKEMGRQGIKKDSFTFSSVLKACGKMLDHEHCGEQVHADAFKLGLVSDNYVQCSLIAMYGRSGLLTEAERVFKKTRNEGNADCWNAMLMGYIENGMHIEAVKFLYQMKGAGMEPQEYLLNEVRSACGSVNCQKRMKCIS